MAGDAVLDELKAPTSTEEKPATTASPSSWRLGAPLGSCASAVDIAFVVSSKPPTPRQHRLRAPLSLAREDPRRDENVTLGDQRGSEHVFAITAPMRAGANQALGTTSRGATPRLFAPGR